VNACDNATHRNVDHVTALDCAVTRLFCVHAATVWHVTQQKSVYFLFACFATTLQRLAMKPLVWKISVGDVY
jgi:hypothetical protein